MESQRFTIEIEVWPEYEADNVYMDIVDALDEYLPYNKVYTILPNLEAPDAE